MLPFAAARRARLILVNRRDYPGSTPLTDTELASLGSRNLQTRAKALAQQGLDIGIFLAWLVREEKIPPVSIDSDGNKRGGIALVAWSLAHTPLAGFLAHADALPADARRALEPCLRAYCIFGKRFPSALSQLLRTTQFNATRPPRCPARLVRASNPKQVPSAGRRDVSDGGTRPTISFLGIDVLHALKLRTQNTQLSSA